MKVKFDQIDKILALEAKKKTGKYTSTFVTR